jgi:hypothetical protein
MVSSEETLADMDPVKEDERRVSVRGEMGAVGGVCEYPGMKVSERVSRCPR